MKALTHSMLSFETEEVLVCTGWPNTLGVVVWWYSHLDLQPYLQLVCKQESEHIRKLGDISPINTPLSHQLEFDSTLKHQINIDVFFILSAQF